MANPSEEWAAKLKVVETSGDGVVQTKIIKRAASDFKFEGELGEGSYSTVMLARDIHTDKLYAIKVLDKRHIVKEKKVKYVNIEKDSLNILGRRNGVIHLFFTFQDEYSLYFVLDYAANGELLSLIKKYGSLNEQVTKYYAAQIMDALKYIHSKGIIHRDLKPENILLDSGYRIQITDFGTAKLLSKDPATNKFIDDGKAKSFVGTAEYVSPELLNDKAVGKPCDIWALGCIIYQMIAGRPPFKATNDYLTFQQVMKAKYAFSAGFPTIIRDLVKRILVPIPEDRPTIRDLEKHLLFQDIDWQNTEQSVWYSPPPEFSAYKISAYAMRQVPELGASPKIRIPMKSRKSDSSGKSFKNTSSLSSSSFVNTGGSTNSATNTLTSEKAASGSNTPTITEETSKKQQAKPRNLSANAAAIALTKISLRGSDIPPSNTKSKKKSSKDINQHRRQHSSPVTGSAVRTARGSDLRMKYHNDVANTNISTLKPNSPRLPVTAKNPTDKKTNGGSVSLPSSPQMGSTTSPVSSPKKPNVLHIRKPQSPKFKVPDFSPVDLEWYKFLRNQHERILKVGVLYIQYMTTETFEKRFKGKLANSPLYFKGKRNSSGNINYSLLTQMVHGNGKFGLRDNLTTNNSSTSSKNQNDEKSISGIIHYVKTNEIQQVDNELQTASANGYHSESNVELDGKGSGGMFKKILNTTKFVVNSGNFLGGNSASVDFHSSRMIIITNLGRLLILGRRPGSNMNTTDNFAKYEVISEIDLTHPSIRIKEVILDLHTNGSSAFDNNSNGNGIPAHQFFAGIFAVITYTTTILFQVDKSLVNQWTECITEARLSGQDYKLKKIIEKDPAGNAGMLTGTEAALAAATLVDSNYK